MSETAAVADGRKTSKAQSMGKFERFLTLWVALCIIVGKREPQSEVGIAFPDDNDRPDGYRFRMEPLRAFCERNRLRIFWVSENSVSEW